MRKIYILFTFFVFSCSNDDSSSPQIEPCETNNTSTIRLFNNTTNTWWYEIPNGNVTYEGSIEAGNSKTMTFDAGTYYEMSWQYRFTYNGVVYKWTYAATDHLGFYACNTNDVSINSDCETHNTGFLVYANASNVPVTITIDGGSYAPLEPGDVEGYEVAAGVTHNVLGTSSLGNYSLSPSVGNCQRLGTVLN